MLITYGTLVLMFYACRHQIPLPDISGNDNGRGNSLGANCSADSVYYVNDIMSIISSNCTMSGCHDDITHAEGVILTSYARIRQYVKEGNTRDSKLYEVIIKADEDRMPPAPMPALTQAQKDKIAKWINQGALNNSCTASCDTSVSTYSGAVKSIMDNKCKGCHNPSSFGGNIDVSTYNALKVIADNGRLLGSVAHQAGYSSMPKNAAKLSDCEITQIQKWIKSGSLNN